MKEAVLSEDENLIEEDNTASPPEMKDKEFPNHPDSAGIS
jgi:hypothetical protein